MSKRLWKVILVSIFCFCLLFSNISNIYAKGDKVTKLEFKHKSITIEEQTKFSILEFLVVTTKEEGSKTGFIREVDGLTFSSSDETIVKLTDKKLGVFSAVSYGTAKITCLVSGSEASIEVHVSEAGALDKDGSLRTLWEEIEALDKTEITTSNIITYYNNLKKLSSKAYSYKNLEGDDYVKIPNKYMINLCWDKISTHLTKNNAIYYSDNPFSVEKISDITKDSVKVTLSRKLTNNDVVAYSMINEKKCSKGLKMKFRAIFLDGKKGASDPYNSTSVDQKKLTLKLGADSFVLKTPSKIKSQKTYSLVMSIDDTYGFTWTKGQHFIAK